MRADPSWFSRHRGARPIRCTARFGVLVILFLSMAVRANQDDEDCQGPTEDCVAVGRWNISVALGAGVRTNPLVGGKDIPLVVIPQISYYGKRFFIDNLDFGFTLAQHGVNTLSLIATPGYDRVFFFRSDLQNFFVGFPDASVPTRAGLVSPGTPGAVEVPRPAPRVTYLAGPEWTFEYGQVSGQLDLLRDATGQNSGAEIRAALSVPLLKSHGTLSANSGFTWKSAATVDYYFRVPIVYAGSAAFDPFVKLAYTLPLAGKWRFNAFAEYEHLGKGIADSPVIAEHGVATVFAGANYAF